MFKVYSSSAGSGKTYTLTKEYIKLALHSSSDTYFKQILAVTFTNAAANEMKDRILLMLRTFGSYTSDQSLPPMLGDVVRELYPETKDDEQLFEDACILISGRAQLVFRQILHRYSDFAVITIDKFTQRLVRSFTDELGIPFAFETVLEGDLLKDAVDHLMERIGQDGEEILTDVVEKYYRENAEGGKSWGSLPDQIFKAASALLSEEAYLEMSKVSDLTLVDWIAIRSQLKKYVSEKEALIKGYGEKGYQLIQEGFLIDKDFYQSGSGIYGYFRDRAEGKKLFIEPNSYVNKTFLEDKWYGGKTTTEAKIKIDEIKSPLEDAFQQIESIRERESPKIVLYKQLERHIYNLSLLGEIRKEFDILLKQTNQVHISDFNKKIIEIVSREPVPFIFERLGEKFNHILIDEFQDTSKLQFANLLPLIENSLASGYFNLVVGDAKQSIYRFRGGDMDLLLHLGHDQVMELGHVLGENHFNHERLWSINTNLAIDHLRTNRRSYREVTDFNNKFFAFVTESLRAEYPLLTEVFDENVQQEIPETVATGGHVQLEFIDTKLVESEEEAPETDAQDAMVSRVLALIVELRSDGFDWRDIAILCRKKKEASILANALQEEGFPLISDDALLLSHSRSLHFVVSFMKVLQNPDDKLARYEATYLFHHVIRREKPLPADYKIIREICGEPGLDTFLGYFLRWGISLTAFRMRQLSVFELSETIMQSFGLFASSSEKEYLFRFLDVVHEFGTRKTNHLGGFLEYWETAKSKKSITIPEDADAIRITTVHKSKGLEYPVVLIPYANWDFAPNPTRDKIWVDLDSIPYDELSLTKANHSVKLSSSMVSVVKDLDDTLVAEQYQDEKARFLVETMNLLYVAFTRPIQRLYILAKKGQKGSQSGTWLSSYLMQRDQEPVWDEGVSQYVISEGHGQVKHAHIKTDSSSYVLQNILSNDRTGSLRLRRLADRIFDTETFQPKYDRLQKVRYLMSRLKSVADLTTTINKMVSEGIFTRSEAGDITNQIQFLMQNPTLQALYLPNSSTQFNKYLLVPNGKLMQVDRMLTLNDGTTVFMSFVGGNGSDENKRHLKKLVKAFLDQGRFAKGVLITLENEMIEWI